MQDVQIVIQGDTLQATFMQAQRAVTPGQSIAIYQKNICIMSAVIE
jgi:tRNA U34 2-thiouridine synthase MnmA/TrmU